MKKKRYRSEPRTVYLWWGGRALRITALRGGLVSVRPGRDIPSYYRPAYRVHNGRGFNLVALVNFVYEYIDQS